MSSRSCDWCLDRDWDRGWRRGRRGNRRLDGSTRWSPCRSLRRHRSRSLGRSLGRSLRRHRSRNLCRSRGRFPGRRLSRSHDLSRNRRRLNRCLDRCLDRCLSWSLNRNRTRSLGRGLGRSLNRSLNRSPNRSLGRSLGRSLSRSLGRSLGRSLNRSLNRSLGRSPNRSLDRSLSGRLNRSLNRSLSRSLGGSLSGRRGGRLDRGLGRSLSRLLNRHLGGAHDRSLGGRRGRLRCCLGRNGRRRTLGNQRRSGRLFCCYLGDAWRRRFVTRLALRFAVRHGHNRAGRTKDVTLLGARRIVQINQGRGLRRRSPLRRQLLCRFLGARCGGVGGTRISGRQRTLPRLRRCRSRKRRVRLGLWPGVGCIEVIGQRPGLTRFRIDAHPRRFGPHKCRGGGAKCSTDRRTARRTHSTRGGPDRCPARETADRASQLGESRWFRGTLGLGRDGGSCRRLHVFARGNFRRTRHLARRHNHRPRSLHVCGRLKRGGWCRGRLGAFRGTRRRPGCMHRVGGFGAVGGRSGRGGRCKRTDPDAARRWRCFARLDDRDVGMAGVVLRRRRARHPGRTRRPQVPLAGQRRLGKPRVGSVLDVVRKEARVWRLVQDLLLGCLRQRRRGRWMPCAGTRCQHVWRRCTRRQLRLRRGRRCAARRALQGREREGRARRRMRRLHRRDYGIGVHPQRLPPHLPSRRPGARRAGRAVRRLLLRRHDVLDAARQHADLRLALWWRAHRTTKLRLERGARRFFLFILGACAASGVRRRVLDNRCIGDVGGVRRQVRLG